MRKLKITILAVMFLLISNTALATEKLNSDTITKTRINEIRTTKNTDISNRVGKIYYVSADGNDDNDGLTPETAWKTTNKVNDCFIKQSIQATDTVLFRKGDTFRGYLNIYANDILIGSYGDDNLPKPEILVSPFDAAKHGQWTKVDTNIWKYIIDGENPFKDDIGVIWFYSKDGTYNYGQKIVTPESFDESNLDIKTLLNNDLEFYQTGHPYSSWARAEELYVYSEINPAERFEQIEFSIAKPGIKLWNYTDLIVDNLTIKYAGVHGIATGTLANLKVTNCEFGYIGGATQNFKNNSFIRFGNAIEIYGSVQPTNDYEVKEGFVVRNNYIYQVYDAGITFQITTEKASVIENVIFDNNVVEYCNYNVEYWNECTSQDETLQSNSYINNYEITNNIMRYAGFGVSQTRPDKNKSAHIKTWYNDNVVKGKYIIENNIFDNSAEHVFYIHAVNENSLPKIKNNTFYNSPEVPFGYMYTDTNTLIHYDIKNLENLYPNNSFNDLSIKSQSENQIFTFTESITDFNNPDRGFYRPTGVRLSPDPESTWWKNPIWYSNRLVHLRIGLKNFSAKYNKVQDYDITEDTIQKLNTWVEQIREAGGTAIVRFAYDDFDGNANLEPDIEQIEKHIEQLKPFFEANEDIIACVETGFLGPYGEQHTSKIVTDENIKRVTDKLLEVVPESRTVSVRRPRYYACVTGANINTIDQDMPEKGTPAYRVGVFNDGYLGSKSDLGTFLNRSKELAWLNKQATHTLYGGEVVLGIPTELDDNGNVFNSPEHIEEEMFITHTSYLNEEWNDKVINGYKNTTYNGKDELYKSSNVFTYVKNHLGYRFVLNKVTMPISVAQSQKLNIKIDLKNVGAGNVVNQKNAYIILKNAEKEYQFITDIDIRELLSLETANYEIPINIDKEIITGEYDVYLKIVDYKSGAQETKRTIRFASLDKLNEDVWNEEIGANKIGKVEIKEQTDSPEIMLGDLDQDGKITVNDLAIMKLHLIGKRLLTGQALVLADIDQNGKVSINDLARQKIKLIEK